MGSRVQQGSRNRHRPQGSRQGGGPGNRRPGGGQGRRRRRRNRIIKAVLAWAVCVILIGIIAMGTIYLVGSLTSSKKRQFRAEGIEKLEAGDYAGALGAFDTALEKSSKKSERFNSDVLRYRAETEYRLKDYAAAIHTYDLLLEMDKDTPEYLYAQSLCHAQTGDTDSAIQCYQAAVDREDKEKPGAGKKEALLAVGNACVDAGEHEKAMAFYDEAIKDGMEDGQIHNQMGICKMAGGDYQGALDSFNKGYETLVTSHSLGSGAGISQAAQAMADGGSGGGGQADKEAAGRGSADKNGGAEAGGNTGSDADGSDLALLKELTYNRAAAYEYLHQYKAALDLFQEFVDVFGANEDAEHEIAFLKTR